MSFRSFFAANSLAAESLRGSPRRQSSVDSEVVAREPTPSIYGTDESRFVVLDEFQKNYFPQDFGGNCKQISPSALKMRHDDPRL